MIWHIFKKDCRLMWPFVAIVAVLHATNAYLWTVLGHFLEPQDLRFTAQTLPMIVLLAMAVVVAVVVQQDPIPGTTQDWLIRPLRRRDLLLEKILFVIAMVHGPIFLIDVTQGLVDGVSFVDSIRLALAAGATKFCMVTLSAFVVASVTRNLTESFVAGFVLVVICVSIVAMVKIYNKLPPPISGGGVNWIGLALMLASIVIVATIVLPRQYFQRATLSSRALIAVGVVVIMASSFVPWRWGFAAQQRFAAQPGYAHSIAIGFEPSMGRRPAVQGAIESGVSSGGVPTIYLPLHIEGLQANTLLFLDRADIRLMSASGETLYQGASYLSLDGNGRVYDSRFVVRQEGDASVATQYQTIFLPIKSYAALKNQSVRLEINYSLTLMKSVGVNVMQALNGEIHTKEGVWCKSRVDNDEDELQVACLSPVKMPSCASIVLVHESSGTSNKKIESCMPDYAPINFNVAPGLLRRVGVVVPFLDKNGAIRYPVDGAKLADAKLIINTFEAQDHFTRQLVIPEIRLSDWNGPGSFKVSVD